MVASSGLFPVVNGQSKMILWLFSLNFKYNFFNILYLISEKVFKLLKKIKFDI